MSSQRPLYIPRRRKAVHNNNKTDPHVSKITGENRQTRIERQKQQQPRFHGAFTGGFSAGYFNTVGTKEGWTPSQIKKKDQRLEDFMDDEDHENWGGPTGLRDEYGTKNTAAPESAMKDHGDPNGDLLSSQSSRTPFLPIKSLLEISHQKVGPRLLRRLGWREGGNAIVPQNAPTINSPALGTASGLSGNGVENDDNTLEILAQVHLSRRKLRKIQLQSSRIKLPPPKLDQCGLGFEPYKDAPEFQRYRDKRKQQARDRASYDSKVNVYRLSDVATTVDGSETSNAVGHASSSRHPSDSNDGEYLSYETAEDFVGKRSASGFALRDDEDDAYDDNGTYSRRNQHENGNGEPQSSRLNVGDEYNTEVYEHESSDDDEYDPSAVTTNSRGPISTAGVDKHAQPFVSTKKSKKSVDVGTMFAEWAGTDQSFRGGKPSSTHHATLTSDGRPLLAGFALGDSMDINKRRYPGPDIPRDYTIQRHEFGEHENPFVLEAISNAVRLEQKEERKSQMRQQHESQRQIQQKFDDSSRPLSKNFSSLAEAMKRRFTSSTEDSSKKGGSTTETSKKLPAGLHMPRPVEKKDDCSEDINSLKPQSVMPQIAITRTTESFFPNPLLCKRFRVPMPTNARRNSSLISTDKTKNNESVYFEREILGKATHQGKNKKQPIQNSDDSRGIALENEEEKPKGIDRPSIENLRKIFQASSDESSSSEDDDSDEDLNKSKSDIDQSLKDESSTLKEDKKPPALPIEDTPIKEGTGFKSEETIVYRASSSQEDEVEKISPRSNDSDDESSRAKSVSSRKRKKESHRRKQNHHRKRHKRKRSRSTDRDYYSDRSPSHEDEDEERQKERRSREHKRRKKKKSSSSSRHKSRKRVKAEKR